MSGYDSQPPPSTGDTTTTVSVPSNPPILNDLPNTGSDVDMVILGGIVLICIGIALMVHFALLDWAKGGRHK